MIKFEICKDKKLEMGPDLSILLTRKIKGPSIFDPGTF